MFSTNIYKPNNINIPTFYLQIHKKIFKYFKKDPDSTIEILYQPLWQNPLIKSTEITINNNDMLNVN